MSPEDYSLSAAARRFLEERAVASNQWAKITKIEDVVQKRIAFREYAAPAAKKAIARYDLSVSERTYGGVRCLVIEPPERGAERQILYLFGGGFKIGGPFEDLVISGPIAAISRARVVAPFYRLAPEHPFPAAVDDCTNVALEMTKVCPDLAIVGESAGGGLALAVVHRLRRLNQPVPAALAVMSALTDLGSDDDSLRANRDPVLANTKLQSRREGYVSDKDIRHPEVSPIFGNFEPPFPPTYISTVTRHAFLSQNARLARAIREGGGTVEVVVWEGLWHVFEYAPELPETRASIQAISRFFHAHLGWDINKN